LCFIIVDINLSRASNGILLSKDTSSQGLLSCVLLPRILIYQALIMVFYYQRILVLIDINLSRASNGILLSKDTNSRGLQVPAVVSWLSADAVPSRTCAVHGYVLSECPGRR